jgi:hypothetical protein
MISSVQDSSIVKLRQDTEQFKRIVNAQRLTAKETDKYLTREEKNQTHALIKSLEKNFTSLACPEAKTVNPSCLGSLIEDQISSAYDELDYVDSFFGGGNLNKDGLSLLKPHIDNINTVVISNLENALDKLRNLPNSETEQAKNYMENLQAEIEAATALQSGIKSVIEKIESNYAYSKKQQEQ